MSFNWPYFLLFLWQWSDRCDELIFQFDKLSLASINRRRCFHIWPSADPFRPL